MPTLDVRHVSAGYGESLIVRDVDLRVGDGETLAVLGPNGHGKTTLMRAITGLLPLASGEVHFQGERVDSRPAEARTTLGLVHVAQGDHLFPELTIEENLLMGAFPKGAWRLRRAAMDRVFGLFPQLHERRGQEARTLSGGERRQTAIGRGLMREPKLLILDEPSLGLAPVIVDAVYATLEEIAAQRTSILLVEENFAHIQSIADRVCVMEMGRIVRSGSPAELADDEAIAQTYLGALP
jgi:branched-chain amino acid transport system ATP-binding protein